LCEEHFTSSPQQQQQHQSTMTKSKQYKLSYYYYNYQKTTHVLVYYESDYLILINTGVDGRLSTTAPLLFLSLILPLRLGVMEKEIFRLAMIAVLIFSMRGVVGGVSIFFLR
jgi:hypothetical protein